jgi:DNA-binding beta-propeller fold protein YncE
VTVDPTGQFVYVASDIDNTISAYKIVANTGALLPVSGSPFIAGSFPQSVTVNPTGRFLYVANADSRDISAYFVDKTMGSLTPVSGSPFPVSSQGISDPALVVVDPTSRFLYSGNGDLADPHGSLSASTVFGYMQLEAFGTPHLEPRLCLSETWRGEV